MKISKLLHGRLILTYFLTLGFFSLALCLHGVPPLAPVIQLVEFSKAGVSTGGSVFVSSRHSYLIYWQDNAIDEEGYEVQIRSVGGAYFTAARVSANVTQTLITPISALAPGQVVQFQIIAWKYNGAAIERSTSTAFNFTVPDGNAESTMTGPGASLQADNLNDSTVKLSWLDRTNSEIYYQIDYWEVQQGASSPTWQTLGFSNLSSASPPSRTQRDLRLRLIPEKDYQFRVRATRLASTSTTDASSWSNATQLRTLPLTAPTELTAQIQQENLLRLTWADNSTNETGYEVQYRSATGGNPQLFTKFTELSEGATSTQVQVEQGLSFEWQVVALYSYTQSNSNTSTTIKSAPSNIITTTTSFVAPTELTAVESGFGSTADLTWIDNTSTEVGFNVYTRKQGTTSWHFARAVRENVTRLSVNSRTEGTDEEGVPVFIPLEVGITHEFIVRAVGTEEKVFSADSNIASCKVKDGFTSRPYHPAQVGVSFTYTVTTTNPESRTTWNVNGLPSGLSFNSSNGVISGTPAQSGIFTCTMQADFADAPRATANLTLRVLPNVTSPLPVPGLSLPNLILGIRSTVKIPLVGKFQDPDAETGVRLETTRGTIDILLYPSLAPRAVENFLSYIRAGDYDNMIFHRLVSGFVLQGGSLRAVSLPRNFASIKSRQAPLNEPGISNTRGTLAAAKLGARTSFVTTSEGTRLKDEQYGYVGNPDSATTDFFFNLTGNSSNLDNQNGGFTAFGRLNALSLNLVDTIATLPKGNYQNTNTGNFYSPSLDKRLIIDGMLTAFSGIPINATEVPEDMDLNKTIRVLKAYETPPIRYQVSSQPTGVLNASIEGNELKLVGVSSGLTNVTLTAIDQDNRSGSMSFQIEVRSSYLPPIITRQPTTQAVRQGSRVTFSVSATGTTLRYQWRKNGQPVGTNANTFVIASAQSNDVGEYDVIVSNGSGTVTSQKARLAIRSIPTIGILTDSKVAEVGKPLTLTLNNVSGAPFPSIQWRRGISVISGQTTPSFSIKASRLNDAGIYSAIAINQEGKSIQSNSVKVIVVDKTPRVQIHTQNTRVTLIAAVSGPDILYNWKKNGQLIPTNQARHSGVTDAVLAINNVEASDIGDYECEITMPDGLEKTTTGPIKLLAVTRPVVFSLTGKDAPNQGFVGVDYIWTIPHSKSDVHTPSRFNLTGTPSLPPGLKFDTTTGTLSGIPSKAGIYKLTATATNTAGTSSPTEIANLIISPLPSANIGVFGGIITASETLNANRGGRFEIIVTDTGTYSSKITLGSEIVSAAGSLGIGQGISNPSGISYQSLLKFSRRDKKQLTLSFEVDSSFGYVAGFLSDGTNTTSITGFRQAWNESVNPCPYGGSPTAITYNLALDPNQGDVGNLEVPQGCGYLSMNVSAKGTASLSGRLADGTSIISNGSLGPAGEIFIFNMLYANTGSLLARFDIGDNLLLGSDGNATLRVGGQARWNRSLQPSSQRLYQQGFNEVYLNAQGAIYYPPGTNRIVMSLPNVDSNAELKFTQAKISSASLIPDRAIRISTTHKISYPSSNAASTVITTLNPTTGIFSGSFSLKDGPSNTPRNVNFQGLIIPGLPYTPEQKNSSGSIIQSEIPASSARGVGYFLLPELIPSTSRSTIYSGSVILRGVPISITTQPLARTVNPGELLSFSVVATGQGTLTYRWRKNGTTIDGATSATYQITSATKTANEGKYDCVISNGSSTITSNEATLTVRAPVTTVSATRAPSTIAAETGSKVTFTATSDGTSPQYQWYKDGQIISGAINQSYVIDSAQPRDNGNYTVNATNPATTFGGVTSNTVGLQVEDPIAITSVMRNPSDTSITAGESVTFSVEFTGSTRELSFQWRKGNAAIDGATNQTYTINQASAADTGGYNVLIKNIISTTGVLSPGVQLDVTP